MTRILILVAIVLLALSIVGCTTAADTVCADVTADALSMQSYNVWQAAFTVGGERVVVRNLTEADWVALSNGATRHVCKWEGVK